MAADHRNYCEVCSTPNVAGHVFCRRCGTALEDRNYGATADLLSWIVICAGLAAGAAAAGLGMVPVWLSLAVMILGSAAVFAVRAAAGSAPTRRMILLAALEKTRIHGPGNGLHSPPWRAP